ncbi:RNA polymerase sigma factor [bacterium]|nr:RNA polymerase sigma factor [bacterium]
MDPESAFLEISPRIFAYLRRLGLSSDDAQDGVQEVFFRAFRSKIDWKSPKAYLFKIAYHIAIDLMRKPKQMLLDKDIPTPFAYEDDFLSVLNQEEKQIILLLYQECLTYEEIANITGKPVGTLKSLVSRAKKKIKEET